MEPIRPAPGTVSPTDTVQIPVGPRSTGAITWELRYSLSGERTGVEIIIGGEQIVPLTARH